MALKYVTWRSCNFATIALDTLSMIYVTIPITIPPTAYQQMSKYMVHQTTSPIYINIMNLLFRELVRFCFMDVLQNDLNCVKDAWNCHRVRINNFVHSPCGKPNMLYSMPASFGKYTKTITNTYIYIYTYIKE